MNREVHVRFWESPEVKVLGATRQKPSTCSAPACLLFPAGDILGGKIILDGPAGEKQGEPKRQSGWVCRGRLDEQPPVSQNRGGVGMGAG